jgi:hypothetical protein
MYRRGRGIQVLFKTLGSKRAIPKRLRLDSTGALNSRRLCRVIQVTGISRAEANLLHNKDFDLLARALALEHRDAVAHGPKRAVAQCEHIALTIADAIAYEQRTFDPVKFMRAACDVAETGQLAPAIQREFETRFGTTRPRPRPNTARSSGLKPDDQIRTGYWEAGTLVDSVLSQVSDSQGAMAAATALMAYGRVHTLGEPAAMSDADLRKIPGLRLGPVTLAAIHKVQELWRARQRSAPETIQVQPSTAMLTYAAGLGVRAEQLEFPVASPAVPRDPAPGRQRPPGQMRGPRARLQ